MQDTQSSVFLPCNSSMVPLHLQTIKQCKNRWHNACVHGHANTQPNMAYIHEKSPTTNQDIAWNLVCLVCITSCWQVQSQHLLHCLAPPESREQAECALRSWEPLGPSGGSLTQKCHNGSEPQNNLLLNILWAFMSFLCVPNHVHQVSLPFWVIVLRDLDVSLEEQLSLANFGFPGCHLHPVVPAAPSGPAAGAASSSPWAWPEDPSGTSTPCAVLAAFASRRNQAHCAGHSWE